MSDVAIVTGASGALGSEVARTLASRGHKLALLDSEHARERVEQLRASLTGCQACVVAGDLSRVATWRQALATTERELGASPSLAAFIAGAYRGGHKLYEEPDDANWTTLLTANLETVHQGLRAVLRPMVAAKRGSIVVVGSRAAIEPWTSAGSAAYATSKAAVVALMHAVAAEVVDDGVRVNAILPSTLDTPANRAAMPKADASRWVPLDSAAGVIAFLLSDDARDIHGAAVPVYGKA